MEKRVKLPYPKLVFGLLLTSLFLVGLAWLTFPDDKLHVYFLDIGQGDSILIRTPQNYKILVDGGRDSRVLSQIGKKLPFWDRQIDLVVATHPDADHIGGLDDVFGAYQVNRFWMPKMSRTTDQYGELINAVGAEEVGILAAKTGDRLELGENLKVEVLWPKDRRPEETDLNQGSIVMLLTYKDFKLLLTGDAEEITQPYPNLASKVTVLKVPHHGSRNGLSKDYLALIKPEIAVVSAGQDNRYGHPAPEILEKLSAAGSKLYRTDHQGTIEVVTDGQNWYTRAER